jgi:Fe-S-cluster-containing hydrogenase component 2
VAKRIVIDLNKCDQCASCGVQCAYFYRPHSQDNGAFVLREKATYALICRRCEYPSCVVSCPYDALERQADGTLKRHNLRCVSCKLCAHACPFGTIFPDMLGFYETPCDYCLKQHNGDPPCTRTCSRGAIQYREVDEDDPEIHIIDDHLAARARKWVKREETA